MKLEDIREEIDAIDREILRALNRRFELAVLAGKLKPQVEDPIREAEVMANVLAHSDGLLDKEFTRELYSLILDKSKALQSGRS
jgi:chorismate mutase